jgi:hypothetical protein
MLAPDAVETPRTMQENSLRAEQDLTRRPVTLSALEERRILL